MIVWGPGGDAKRQAIVDNLRAQPNTAVATPEELLAEIPALAVLGSDPWFQEEVQATEADLIVCLIKNGPTGAPAEITKFKDHADIGPKVRLLKPKTLASSDSILLNAVKRFPGAQSKAYTPAQLVGCNHLRSQAREWLEAARLEKWRRGWRAAHPVN